MLLIYSFLGLEMWSHDVMGTAAADLGALQAHPRPNAILESAYYRYTMGGGSAKLSKGDRTFNHCRDCSQNADVQLLFSSDPHKGSREESKS